MSSSPSPASSSFRVHSPHTRAYRDSRSQYPSFLSLEKTIRLQLSWAISGLVDSFRWDRFVSTVAGDATIQALLSKSVLLNGLSAISIHAFDIFLFPMLQGHQKPLSRSISSVYQLLWMFPLIAASLYLNSFWSSAIAKRTFALRHGTRHSLSARVPTTYSGILNAIATSAYRIIMMLTSATFSFGLSYLPYGGSMLSFLFLCWVNSYYCFEFVWIERGLSLAARVRHLEERWSYYLAFGLPSMLLCSWGSGLANAAVFALFFPVFVIMAMHARPVPNDPYSPSTTSSGTIIHPSPFIPIRLPIFGLVIWLNDLLLTAITMGQYRSRRQADIKASRNTDIMEEGHGGDSSETFQLQSLSGYGGLDARKKWT